MNKQLSKLTRRYVATLRKYLTDGREAVLEEAYELGRVAIASGLGVLDMARLQEAATKNLLQPLLVPEGQEQVLNAKEIFFLETLSPFEAAHRGFREINSKLQERNLELELEIGEHKRTEKALRESENHFRELFNQTSAWRKTCETCRIKFCMCRRRNGNASAASCMMRSAKP